MSTVSVARRLPVLIGVALAGSVFIASAAHAAQGPVGLGTADSFGVLAGSGITNTGATTITGDVGTFPTPSETGMSDVTLTGTNHRGDAVTQGAKDDLVAAYNDAAGRNPSTSVPVELGGTTLLPGVYTSPTFGLTGTLTLDAQGDPNAEFVFQAGSTLITASDSRVLVINGGVACNVVWQVGSSATFGTGTDFVGDVLAHTSISANNSATFQGRLLARNGAVTLIHNTIARPSCAAVVPTPTPTPTPTSTPTPKPTKTAKPHPTPTATHRPGHPSPKPTSSSHKHHHHGPTATPTPTHPGHHGGGGNGSGTNSGPKLTSSHVHTSLPNTGIPVRELVGSALALLGLGLLMVAAGQTRRRGTGRHQT